MVKLDYKLIHRELHELRQNGSEPDFLYFTSVMITDDQNIYLDYAPSKDPESLYYTHTDFIIDEMKYIISLKPGKYQLDKIFLAEIYSRVSELLKKNERFIFIIRNTRIPSERTKRDIFASRLRKFLRRITWR